jgi:hypothetical protein
VGIRVLLNSEDYSNKRYRELVNKLLIREFIAKSTPVIQVLRDGKLSIAISALSSVSRIPMSSPFPSTLSPP